MAWVVALKDITSSFRDVGNRSRGERFECADWLAVELEEAGEVRMEDTRHPKGEGASTAGPVKQRLSSPRGRASPKGK